MSLMKAPHTQSVCFLQ